MSEPLPYTVVRAFPCFDVRRYPARILVQVRVDSPVHRVGLAAARPVRRYLGGHNVSGTVVAAGAGLLYEPVGESTSLLSIVLPTADDPAGVPAPRDDAVCIRTVPAHEAAVLRFAGRFSGPRLRAHGRELLAEVWRSRLEPLGGVYYARSEPVWTSGVFGHHEALVRVTSA
jgi:hypothetical protein